MSTRFDIAGFAGDGFRVEITSAVTCRVAGVQRAGLEGAIKDGFRSKAVWPAEAGGRPGTRAVAKAGMACCNGLDG